jgi:hypothetical protein
VKEKEEMKEADVWGILVLIWPKFMRYAKTAMLYGDTVRTADIIQHRMIREIMEMGMNE